MIDTNTRAAESPLDHLSAIREWLWRHSSQPNGDPWDSDPEHLEQTARNLLNDLQGFLSTMPPPASTMPSPSAGHTKKSPESQGSSPTPSP